MAETAVTTETQTMMDGSLFEGLVKLLKPEGAFAADLRAAGYDMRNPQLRYPLPVLMAVLDVASRHVYPDLSREDAHRRLGQRFVDSFLGTILGKVLGGLLRMLGTERFLLRMPKLASMGTSGLEVKVQRLAPGVHGIVFRSHGNSPDFVAGAVEGASWHGDVAVRAEVVRRDPDEFELLTTEVKDEGDASG